MANRRMPVRLPPGTIRALVRRMVLPTRNGELVVTPLIESLQLIVIDPGIDPVVEKVPERHFKFVLDRTALLAGGDGLRAVGRDETLDAWGFGSMAIRGENKTDTDGDLLPSGRAVSASLMGGIYNCALCHQERRRQFANFSREGSPVEERSFADQVHAIIAEKEKSEGWKMYRALVRSA